MHVYTIKIEDTDICLKCRVSKSVLEELERQNCPTVSVGCRGGGCGVCRVEVLVGKYSVGKMSRAQVNIEEEKSGIALACQLYPESDLVLRLLKRKGQR